MGLLDDAVALGLDPSGTLLAAKKAAETEAKRRAEEAARRKAAEAAEEVAEALSRAPAEAVPEEKVCCIEWQIQDDFLLNTRTGAVWKYDKNSNSFKPITKELEKIQAIAIATVCTSVLEEWRDAKTKESAKFHHTARKDFEFKVDAMINALEEKVKGLVPHSP